MVTSRVHCDVQPQKALFDEKQPGDGDTGVLHTNDQTRHACEQETGLTTDAA
jgi:hypothetical protein